MCKNASWIHSLTYVVNTRVDLGITLYHTDNFYAFFCIHHYAHCNCLLIISIIAIFGDLTRLEFFRLTTEPLCFGHFWLLWLTESDFSERKNQPKSTYSQSTLSQIRRLRSEWLNCFTYKHSIMLNSLQSHSIVCHFFHTWVSLQNLCVYLFFCKLLFYFYLHSMHFKLFVSVCVIS